MEKLPAVMVTQLNVPLFAMKGAYSSLVIFILANLLFCMLVTGFKVTNVCMGPQALARPKLVNLMYHLCTASTIAPVVASKLQKLPVRAHDVVRYPLVVTPRLTDLI